MDNLRCFLILAGVACLAISVEGKPSLADYFKRSQYALEQCEAEGDERQPCGRRYDAIGKWECMARGCCWDDASRLPSGTIRCFLADRMLSDPQCDVEYEEKDECEGSYYEMSEGECIQKECCWRPSPRVNDAYCYKKKSASAETTTTTSAPGQSVENLRLIYNGEESTSEGRVEVFYNNEWGTVCDDSFGSDEANVICKQFGHSGGSARNEAYYGQGEDPIWLDEMACTGYEDSFFDCDHSYWGQHDCSHYEDAGVVCY